jgi:hypothetical protein
MRKAHVHTVRFDHFMLDLLESVERELASALEVRHQRRYAGETDESPTIRDQSDRIARLLCAIDALQAALDRRDSPIVH